ncbi:MAG: ArnT family glycosyltransferase, partial [bacterium]
WEWSRSLAPGYFDQGPGLALAIRLGTLLLGNTQQGVRCVSVFSGFAVSGLAAWMVSSVLAVPGLAVWTVLAFNGALIFAVGGVLMMHDSLMALGWMFSLACGLLVLRRSPRWWLGVGLGAAWALLSKYTAVLLFGCLGLGVWCVPGLRRRFRGPWAWAGLALGILGSLAPFWWNATHGWPSFHHIGGLAGGDRNRRRGLPWLELLGSQAGLITPLLWFACLAGWVRGLRRWRAGTDSDEERWLLLLSLPVALFFFALSLRTRVEGNWPSCAYLGALPLAGLWLWERARKLGQLGTGRLGTWALVVAFGMTVLTFTQALHPFLPFPQSLAKADAPARMDGWAALGARVERERMAMGGAGVFTATLSYQNAAELAFYQPGQERCALLSDGPPQNEYRFWDDYSSDLGRNAIAVAGQASDAKTLARHFQRLSALPDEVLVRNHIEVRRTHLWRAYGFKG